jgi:hypothetical protein
MFNELEPYLESTAVFFAHHQGLHFSSQQEAARYVERVKAEIRQAIKHSNAVMVEGLTCFKEMNLGYVSTLSAKLLKHLDSSKKLAKLIEQEIVGNDQAAFEFINAVHQVYDCGDVQKEYNAILVLMRFFPLHPQPYIYYGSWLWRKEGIAAAENFYTKMVQEMEDPALDYAAADCLFKNKNKSKAKELLERALKNTETSLEMYGEVREMIVDLLGKC